MRLQRYFAGALAAALVMTVALTTAIAAPPHPPGSPGGGPRAAPGVGSGPAISGADAARITGCFPGSGPAVSRLRAMHWGYGEVVTGLYLARQSGTSIDGIIAMRNAGLGWGQIAERLGLPPTALGRAESFCH